MSDELNESAEVGASFEADATPPVQLLNSRSVALAVAVIGLIAVLASVASALSNAAASVDDYGTVVRGKLAITRHEPYNKLVDEISDVTVKLPITNPWDHGIAIDDIDSSCGCSSASVADKALAPGQSTTLTAKVSLPAQGDSKRLHFTLNAADGFRLVQHVQITVFPHISVDVDGSGVPLIRVPPAEAQAAMLLPIVLRDRKGASAPIEILSISSDSALAHASLEPDPENALAEVGSWAERRKGIRVRVLRDRPGWRTAELAVNYRAEGSMHSHKVPVRWFTEPEWEVTPARVFFSIARDGVDVDRPNGTKTIAVALRRADGAESRIEAIEYTADWLSVERASVEIEAMHEVSVTVDLNQVREDAYTEIVVRTDSEGEPSITIPVGIKVTDVK